MAAVTILGLAKARWGPHNVQRTMIIHGRVDVVPMAYFRRDSQMPTYEYECSVCGSRFNRLRPVADRSAPTPCPSCSSELTELVFSRVSAGESGCGSKTTGFS